MNIINSLCYSQSPKWGALVKDAYDHPFYHIEIPTGLLRGCIDLVHMKHIAFGNTLVSMPFSDVGGFSVCNQKVELKLLWAVLDLAAKCKADTIELRMDRELPWLNQDLLSFGDHALKRYGKLHVSVQSHKVKMVLDLPLSSDDLMNGFKSKLRSQIRRPIKEGMRIKIGKKELLDDFYHVFSINMRDLGSPVHSKHFFKKVLEHFHGISDVVAVYDKYNIPVAVAIVIGNGNCLSNPWASSLKEYRAVSPNMLLYWAMLKYGIDNGYSQFDFGRSTPGEGTYTFKEQWGAKQVPLYWYSISGKRVLVKKPGKENTGFGMMAKLWQHLPVSIANVVGPLIRKDISL